MTPDPKIPAVPVMSVDPVLGMTISGRFRILSLIARGGMGRVYRAEQIPLGRVCAIKVVNAGFTSGIDPEFHRRFFLEASTSSKLKHPNTVTVFDYGKTDDDIYFMAMELLEGRTIHRALREDGPFAIERVIHIAGQMARSLREAHGFGVIHRDLKPANVFLVTHGDERDFVKVLDFGLVKNLEERQDEQLTQTGLFMGSPKYMAPEQIEGNKVDGRTDLYALGVMMYEMATGKVPFDRATSVNTLMAHVHEAVPAMRTTNPAADVSDAFETLVRRCMSKDPSDRPASMDDLISELKDYSAGGSGPQVARGSMRALRSLPPLAAPPPRRSGAPTPAPASVSPNSAPISSRSGISAIHAASDLNSSATAAPLFGADITAALPPQAQRVARVSEAPEAVPSTHRDTGPTLISGSTTAPLDLKAAVAGERAPPAATTPAPVVAAAPAAQLAALPVVDLSAALLSADGASAKAIMSTTLPSAVRAEPSAPIALELSPESRAELGLPARGSWAKRALGVALVASLLGGAGGFGAHKWRQRALASSAAMPAAVPAAGPGAELSASEAVHAARVVASASAAVAAAEEELQTLRLVSEPAGAVVHDVNGVQICAKTPCDVRFSQRALSAGVDVWLQRQGYAELRRTLTLADRNGAVRCSLRRPGAPLWTPGSPGATKPGAAAVPASAAPLGAPSSGLAVAPASATAAPAPAPSVVPGFKELPY